MMNEIYTIEEIRLEVVAIIGKEITLYDSDLFKTGMLDSLGFLTLISKLEAKFDFSFSAVDIRIDHFRSVDSISNLVGKKIKL